MVKKAKWLKNVKKAFSPDSKKLKHESAECQNSVISYPVLVATSRSSPPQFEVRVDEVNYEHKKILPPPPLDCVTTTEADVLVDSPPSSPESVHQATVDRFPGKSKEEASSILIQTTFRGYLARRELREMRRLARLKLMMEGSVVQRQAANTLKCMQTLSRVQSQIRSRRIRMSEENQARHKQLLQKHAKELGGLKNGGNWNDSNQSKEQIEAGMLHKYEATMRRERALAYAFTHQQNLKNNSKFANPMFMDPSNPTWGWSWLERWMAGRPWESSEKEQHSNSNNNNEKSSVKTSTNRNSHGKETTKSSNRNKLNSSTQPNTSSSSSTTTITRNPKKKRPIPSSIKSKTTDEVSKSSERNHRHSIARSSVSDDESLASSTARRSSYVVPTPTTKPARGKVKPQSSSRVTVNTTTTEENGVLPEKAPAKKRLSHSASPAPKPRRSSAPPKVENGALKAERTP
ncbi:Protein IQ-DOMAIN 1 [Cardamine amara subsp. amara]|uniref:Protein IQ-DOMAIN 1 n=1 Tax=Cardamine amara subsp. amara TaxID=228776 RepID=A0ABD1A2C7_CARAN